MQINRLFEIVYILLGKKTTTAKELAERFEVSVRTIYRDIDTLSSAGIPIYASQGKGGGISLMDDYILNKSVLSENEQDEILFALQSLTITQNPETDRVLSKLSSLFNKSKTNWIEVDLSPWDSDKNRTCEFTILKNAILNHQIIEFCYFNESGEKSHRRAEPEKLLFKTNAWYLQAFCLFRNEYRTFKISRIFDLHITQETFTGALDWPVVFDDIHFNHRPYDPVSAYTQSKAATVLFAIGADRHWGRDGITANALMPGAIATNLQRHFDKETLKSWGALDDSGNRLRRPKGWKTPEQGAATSVLLAASPLLEGIGGRFFMNCNESEIVNHENRHTAIDAKNADRLWDIYFPIVQNLF